MLLTNETAKRVNISFYNWQVKYWKHSGCSASKIEKKRKQSLKKKKITTKNSNQGMRIFEETSLN